jgi:hypothetical protein
LFNVGLVVLAVKENPMCDLLKGKFEYPRRLTVAFGLWAKK